MKWLFNNSELNTNEKISVVFLSLISFLLPIYQKIIPLLIAIWAFHSLISKLKSFSFRVFFENKITVLLCTFFLFHVITLLVTENISSGLFDIESKLSLLIFPVFLLINQSAYIKNASIVLHSFILGSITAGIICISHSLFLKIEYNATWQYFTYTDLSILMHPSYFAMYLSLAIVISVNYLLSINNNIKRTFYILTILFFILLIVLLSSKAGLILIILIAITSAFKLIKFSKKNIIIGAIALFTLSIFIVKNDRFSQMTDSLYNHYVLGKTQVESTNERIIVWGNVINQLKTNWLFGTGAGDLKYDLIKEYQKSNFNIGEEKMLNAHNQYLETFLSVGIFGIINLLSLLILSYNKQVRDKNYMLFGFILIISINFIFESILNNQAGIVFFSMFMSIFSILNIGSKSVSQMENSTN